MTSTHSNHRQRLLVLAIHHVKRDAMHKNRHVEKNKTDLRDSYCWLGLATRNMADVAKPLSSAVTILEMWCDELF